MISFPPRREPSIVDVAREAGVSAQTVSRVANGKDGVRPQTRDRVVQAMQVLGYRPNRAARALKAGKYGNIGVIMFSLSSYGNMRILEAIATEATSAGYSLTLIPLKAATQSSVSGAFVRLSEQAVDGIIVVIESHILNESDIQIPAGLPVVIVGSSPRYGRPAVDTDQKQGARLATEYLLDLGHPTVWHVSGPEESFAAQLRRESWQETVLGRGGHVLPEVLVGDWSAQSGRRIGERLAWMPGVTAIFAANDQMALGVMHAMHEAGRRVPGDVSVVGFDDMSEAGDFWPALTTVRQHFERLGVAAVKSLVAVIDGQEIEETSRIATELIVRDSAAPYRADGRQAGVQ